ncbi:putative lipid II flippase FtsW [Candidatus Saccharibacteria bacterium]|nr:putative lipid II flippase FtsW [Candidatus Saccharibacteria bacterium]
MFDLRRKKHRNRRAQPSLSTSTGENSSLISRKHKPDYGLLLICIALLIIGMVVMYSISPGLAAAQGVSQHYYIGKQFIAIAAGLIAFAIFSAISLDFLKRSKRTLVWLSLIMIIAVQIFGEKVNGAYRWIQFGGFSFQVAELLKFALIVWLASFLVSRLVNKEINSNQKTLNPIMILLGLIAVLVAGMQSDFGSAGVMFAITIVMSFSAGLPIKRILMIGGIIAAISVIAVVSTPYRRDRLATFLNPTSDCQDAGYQSCQALIAVGSGGIFGLGLGNGVQAYGYLPEAENDSIFAILAEKFGFIGSTAIIALYAILFARMRRIIICTKDTFSRLFVIGVLAWLSTQTIINIGAMIGLLPLKGITLPLISYGGTSIVFIMAALGVVFHISKYTSFAPLRNVDISESEVNGEDSSGRRRQRRPYYATASGR